MAPVSKTLDELLAETGLTRDEWQRGRKLFEEMWRDVAKINGWVPRPEMVRFSWPLALNCNVILEFSREPNTEDLSKLIEILTLVAGRESDVVVETTA